MLTPSDCRQAAGCAGSNFSGMVMPRQTHETACDLLRDLPELQMEQVDQIFQH